MNKNASKLLKERFLIVFKVRSIGFITARNLRTSEKRLRIEIAADPIIKTY